MLWRLQEYIKGDLVSSNQPYSSTVLLVHTHQIFLSCSEIYFCKRSKLRFNAKTTWKYELILLVIVCEYIDGPVGVSDISGKNYRMPINRHLSNYRQNYRYRKIEILKLSKNYRYRKMHQIWSDKFMES